MNFKYSRDYGNYSWIDVGNYSGLSDERELEFERLFEIKMHAYPPSICSDPCQIGQVIIIFSIRCLFFPCSNEANVSS